ncbi:MAG: LysR family transcriptional regulator [Faecalibacterium sp.]
MNTFQLICFLTIAEHLNFTKAAESLHITQPAIGQQIRTLEKELGVKLFERTTRSVKLTKEGKSFLNDAGQIVKISDRAKKRFASTSFQEIEHLSIGCANFPYMYQLINILETLRTRMPNLHPDLQVIPFQHIYRILEEGELDAVIGFQEPASVKISARYKELKKIPMRMICSHSHAFADRRRISIRELQEERLVLFEPPKIFSNIAQWQAQLMETKDISELYFCSSAEAITVLVTAGYGISILPDNLIPESPWLKKIPLKDIRPASFGIYYKSILDKSLLEMFINEAKEAFAQENES